MVLLEISQHLQENIKLLNSFDTAQNMKLSIINLSNNVTKFAVSCRFGHIYWRDL